MNNSVDFYLKEMESFNTLSATEQFKIRVNLNQITKQMDDLSQKLDQFLVNTTNDDSNDTLGQGKLKIFRRIKLFIFY